ncbi:MAG: NADH:flavin oxidoreductase [bacterium]
MVELFEQARLGPWGVKNRIVRSATYEGMADTHGFPTDAYKKLYRDLARFEVGTIITGFVYICPGGRAMQPNQAGLDNSEKIPFYKSIVDQVHEYGSRIFVQLAHAGRQTRREATHGTVWGVSGMPSFYFRHKPQKLTTDQALGVIDSFADSAVYAKEAGFDGVQLHAGHGYLIHQFLLPSINTRTDLFKVDETKKIGTTFLEMIIDKIRERCGDDFPLLIKVSASDDYTKKFSKDQFIALIRFLNAKKLAAIEISYGTMDHALNIIRGDIPLDLILAHNPIYKINNPLGKILWKLCVYPFLKIKIRPFFPMYNLESARCAKEHSRIPIMCVGGFRKRGEMDDVLKREALDFVSMCRPFVCERDLVIKLRNDPGYTSQCVNCNMCTIMCDSPNPTHCWRNTS